MTRKVSTKFTGSIFTIVGLATLGLSAFFTYTNVNIIKNGVEVTCTISRIETSYDEDSTSHTVYVIYTYDGDTVSGKLDTYTSSMREGQELVCYFLPSNPTYLVTKNGGYTGAIITGILGVTFTACGLGMVIKNIKYRNLFKLKESGQRIDAKIVDVKINRSIQVNGRYPMIITFEGMDGNTYKSSKLFDQGRLCNDGDRVTLYVDNNNHKRFYIDFDSLITTSDSRPVDDTIQTRIYK